MQINNNIIIYCKGKTSTEFKEDPNCLYNQAVRINNLKTHCDFCGIEFDISGRNCNASKTLHHNHFTGDYIASLCNKCNLTVDLNYIPVRAIAHNSVKYDQHLIMRKL